MRKPTKEVKEDKGPTYIEREVTSLLFTNDNLLCSLKSIEDREKNKRESIREMAFVDKEQPQIIR